MKNTKGVKDTKSARLKGSDVDIKEDSSIKDSSEKAEPKSNQAVGRPSKKPKDPAAIAEEILDELDKERPDMLLSDLDAEFEDEDEGFTQ